MISELEIQNGNAERIGDILDKSLQVDEKVSYGIETQGDKLCIKTHTEGLGILRGCTDTVFRLTMLSDKLYSR